MKKLLSLILSTSLIISLFSACGADENAQIYSEIANNSKETSENTSENEDMMYDENTLLISTPEKPQDYIGIGSLAAGFMEKYPEITIIFDSANIDILNMTFEEVEVAQESYSQNLKIDMISGNTPDLIYDSTGSVEIFASSGLLKDMNELIDSDTDFDRDDYFDTVLRAYEHLGGLYLFPITVNYPMVKLRQDVVDAVNLDLDSINGLDYVLAYDIYNSLLETNLVPDIKTIGREARENRGVFTVQEYTTAYDRDTLTFSFDTPEFIDFLNTSNSYTAATPNVFGSFLMYTDIGERVFDTEGYFVEGTTSMTTYFPVFFAENEKASDMLPVVSSKGETMLSATCMSIPENAKNHELAWEFIKYCVEESDEVSRSPMTIGHWNGDRFDFMLPINKSNFERYVALSFVGYDESVVNEIVSQIRAPLEGDVIPMFTFDVLSKTLNEVRQSFYDGQIDAQECAKKMQELSEIFILENK